MFFRRRWCVTTQGVMSRLRRSDDNIRNESLQILDRSLFVIKLRPTLYIVYSFRTLNLTEVLCHFKMTPILEFSFKDIPLRVNRYHSHLRRSYCRLVTSSHRILQIWTIRNQVVESDCDVSGYSCYWLLRHVIFWNLILFFIRKISLSVKRLCKRLSWLTLNLFNTYRERSAFTVLLQYFVSIWCIIPWCFRWHSSLQYDCRLFKLALPSFYEWFDSKC